MREMVFMAVLSRLLACAMRRCSPAISRLSRASRWDMMLYNCQEFGYVSLYRSRAAVFFFVIAHILLPPLFGPFVSLTASLWTLSRANVVWM